MEMSRNDKKSRNTISTVEIKKSYGDTTAGDVKTESTVLPDHLTLTLESSLSRQAAVASSMCTNSLYS